MISHRKHDMSLITLDSDLTPTLSISLIKYDALPLTLK